MMRSSSSCSTLSGVSLRNHEDSRKTAITQTSSGSCMSRLGRSETATFGHEPFTTFQYKVELLCRLHWRSGLPKDHPKQTIGGRLKRLMKAKKPLEKNFEIEKMQGGSYNRITGIAVTNEVKKCTASKYILRVPRYSNQNPAYDAAILQYVHRNYATIPVPEVIAVDSSKLNPLGQAYMIQRRLSGISAHGPMHSYRDLTQAQQCQFASQFGRILKDLSARGIDEPGLIEEAMPISAPFGKRKASIKSFRIRPFDVGTSMRNPSFDPDEITRAGVQPEYASPLIWLQTQFARLRASALRRHNELEAEYYDTFAAMAAQLDAADCLGRDDKYVLTHLDLNMSPHNILLDVDKQGKLTITGILDRDSTVIGPAFMACQPPMWLWAWDGDERADEREAGYTPETEEKRERKQVFEDAVGEEWLRYAYSPGYRIARRLCEFAIKGASGSREFDLVADDLIDEWVGMRPRGMERIRSPMELGEKFLLDDDDEEEEAIESEGSSCEELHFGAVAERIEDVVSASELDGLRAPLASERRIEEESRGWDESDDESEIENLGLYTIQELEC